MLQVTSSPQDAKKSLAKVIPAMESAITIQTSQGDMCLHGHDARKVMELVTSIAQSHVNAAWRKQLFASDGVSGSPTHTENLSNAEVKPGQTAVAPYPIVVVRMEGGVIHCVNATAEMRVILLDADTEGADEDRIAEVDGDTFYVHDYRLTLDHSATDSCVDVEFVTGMATEVDVEFGETAG